MFDGSDDHYLSVGQSAAQVIQRALHGRPDPHRILDLPCGHGRVTRVLRALYPASAITVCDIDRSAVDFAARHFDALGVYSQEDFRALDLAELYDMIWVGSLITHLPEQQTRRFFDFAARHLAEDGTLIITSHGGLVAQRLLKWNYGLTDEAVRGLLADSWLCGYGYRSYPGGEGYGISLVRRAWFYDLFAAGPLCLDSYEEQGWDRHQDVMVIRRRVSPPAQPESFWSRWRRAFREKPRPQAGAYEAGATPPIPSARQSDIDRQHVAGFDEGWYLAADPLVARDVAAGIHTSGFDHFCKYGWREARAVCDASLGYDARPRLPGRQDIRP